MLGGGWGEGGAGCTLYHAEQQAQTWHVTDTGNRIRAKIVHTSMITDEDRQAHRVIKPAHQAYTTILWCTPTTYTVAVTTSTKFYPLPFARTHCSTILPHLWPVYATLHT